MTTTSFISSAEAAFIAGVTDREINRVIDERLVPDSLLQRDPGRRIARLATVFISFYFKTEALFTAQLRRHVAATITDRIRATDEWAAALSLTITLAETGSKGWFTVTREEAPAFSLDLSTFFRDVSARAGAVDEALEQVSIDPDVMGGVPVFKGTRVPIDTVLASMDAGVDLARLQASYPFLTAELVAAARVFDAVRPRRGRPRRLSEANPGWKVKRSKVVQAVCS